MDKRGVEQIIEEIESNEQLGDEENTLSEEELDEMCDEEDEECEAFYGDDEDPEEEIVQVTKTITVVSQPIITTVTVGAEVDSEGAVKPVCKVSIERHHEGETGTSTEVYDIIAGDFAELAYQVDGQIQKLKRDANKGMN